MVGLSKGIDREGLVAEVEVGVILGDGEEKCALLYNTERKCLSGLLSSNIPFLGRDVRPDSARESSLIPRKKDDRYVDGVKVK